MQANPEKFQLIIFGNFDDVVSIEVENEVMQKPLKCVNVLGVHIDHLLNFRTHVASMNLFVNALARVSKCLDTSSRISILK